VFNLSVMEVNRALTELAERIDRVHGLRGISTVKDIDFRRETTVSGPAAKAIYTGAGFQLATGAWSDVFADPTPEYDTDNLFIPLQAALVFTIRTAGKYRVTGACRFASNATGLRYAALATDTTGTFVRRVRQTLPAISGDETQVAVSSTFDFAVGNRVKLSIQQTSGGNLASGGSVSDEFTTFLAAEFLSA